MEALWVWIALAMLGAYVIWDGARGDRSPRGSEILLLAAAASLYLAGSPAYPALLAIVVVMLLRLTHSRIWFGVAALAAAVALMGYALSSSVPLAAVAGLCTVAVLALQNSAGMALASTGESQDRCRRTASHLWWAVLASYVSLTVALVATKPDAAETLLQHQWTCGFAVLALAGLIGSRLCLGIGFDFGVLASASGCIAGLIATAAGTVHVVATTAAVPRLASVLLGTLVIAAAYRFGVNRWMRAGAQTNARASRASSWV